MLHLEQNRPVTYILLAIEMKKHTDKTVSFSFQVKSLQKQNHSVLRYEFNGQL